MGNSLAEQWVNNNNKAKTQQQIQEQVYIDFLVSLRCIYDPWGFGIIFSFSMASENFIFIDLIQILLGGIIPSTVVI